MSQENIAIARQVTEAQNENDIEKLQKLLSSDFKSHIADWPEPLNREQYIEGVQMSHRAFSRLKFTIEDLFGEGEKVALRIHATGMHTGEYQGLPPTCKQVSFSGTAIRIIKNGLVHEEWQINDQCSLLKQLRPQERNDGKISVEGVLWNRIVNVGRALEKLDGVLDNDIFDDLSKHNPKWDSKHEPESETLFQVRGALRHINDQLWEIFSFLKEDE